VRNAQLNRVVGFPGIVPGQSGEGVERTRSRTSQGEAMIVRLIEAATISSATKKAAMAAFFA